MQYLAQLCAVRSGFEVGSGVRFACCTGTKVQIVTQNAAARPADASVHAYVEHFLRLSNASPDAHDTDTADEQAQAYQAVLQQRLQPLLAVRVSQHLDALERAAVAAILYHCGELARVFPPAVAGAAGGGAAAAGAGAGAGADTRLLAEAGAFCNSCNAASLAARAVRRHAMELRDHANLALKESEEPEDWMVYCQVLSLLALLGQKYKY